MPRAKVPRTAIEYLNVVDKRGVADLCRIFGCSRRAAEDLVLQARRAVAQGRRYEILDPPTGAAAVANYRRPPMPGRALTDAEVRELAAGIDPPELKGLTADQRRAWLRERQDQERRRRNEANGIHETDPAWLARWQGWMERWSSMSHEERQAMGATPQEQEREWPA